MFFALSHGEFLQVLQASEEALRKQGDGGTVPCISPAFFAMRSCPLVAALMSSQNLARPPAFRLHPAKLPQYLVSSSYRRGPPWAGALPGLSHFRETPG